MTVARSLLVDVTLTRFYHCISRCVRRAFLCGDGFEHRKQWIENRLEVLARNFAVSVCGFAIMDNHLHILCRLDPKVADSWSPEEVVRRWIAVYPPRNLDLDDSKTLQMWVDHEAKNAASVAKYRERLRNLGWFMKSLKEPLARMANREDDCSGTFWESRYQSIAILDEEALLATCAYIDLNPVAAGIAATPETSRHTSIRQRVQHAKDSGELDSLREAAKGSVAGFRASKRSEQSHWLCPFGTGTEKEARREGMLGQFSLGSYLLLVDYTSRLYRAGKARVSKEVAGIFDRLGTSAEYWDHRLKKLMGKTRLTGSYLTTQPDRLKAIAQQRGVHHVDNAMALG